MNKQFNLQDVVKVSGYDKALYEITQYTRYAVYDGGVEQVEHEYMIKPLDKSVSMVAYQEDIIMVKPKGSIDMEGVNALLDSYNDDLSLYQITGDADYYARAQETMMVLQETQIIL